MVLCNAAHFVRDTTTSELAEIMASPDSYRLLYFPIEGLGQTTRDMLTFGNAKWESVSPEDWSEEKGRTPFGCLPVLFVVKSGKEVILSESVAIENYLAKRFGLLGDNVYEETVIKAFHASSLSLMGIFAGAVTWTFPQVQEQGLEFFKTQSLANWIWTHERHLVDNGSNGHYLGDKLTLADIKTANVIDHLSLQPCGVELIEMIKKSPALWKVKETVDAHPKLAHWRTSDAFKKLADSTAAYYKNPMGLN